VGEKEKDLEETKKVQEKEKEREKEKEEEEGEEKDNEKEEEVEKNVFFLLNPCCIIKLKYVFTLYTLDPLLTKSELDMYM